MEEDLKIPVEIKEPEQMIVDLPWLKERLSKAKKGRKKIKKTTNTSRMEESVEGPGPAPSTKRARDDDEYSSEGATPVKVARPPDTVSHASKRSATPTEESSNTKKWKTYMSSDSDSDGNMKAVQAVPALATVAPVVGPAESASSDCGSPAAAADIIGDLRAGHTVQLRPHSTQHVAVKQLSPRGSYIIQVGFGLKQRGVTTDNGKLGNEICLRNDSEQVITMKKGQRIAQVILKHDDAYVDPVETAYPSSSQ